MSHAFTFSTVARTVQVRLRSGEDVAHLAELPKPYWLTLSCPVKGLGPRGRAVAEALDTDHDGRVRVAEVLAAIAWLKPRLASFDCLFAAEAGLALSEIAAARGQTLAQLALQWVLRDEVVTSALIGASRPEQITENLAALRFPPLSAQELAAIDAALAQ